MSKLRSAFDSSTLGEAGAAATGWVLVVGITVLYHSFGGARWISP